MRPIFQAACAMFLVVALGAFGAHALHGQLEAAGHVDTWETAVIYHALHGLALLAIGVWQAVDGSARASAWVRASGWFWLVGMIAFSGSLYGYSLGGPGWLVFVTPIGGLSFLLGWAALAIGVRRLGRIPTTTR